MARKVTHVSPAERLRLVREIDIFHPWQSLDEKRFCRRCGGTFRGAEIKVVSAQDGTGYRLECPTEGCPSVPIEWIIVEAIEKPQSIDPRLRAQFPRRFLPARHPQYRPALFGFLRVPQII
ncbi:MAG TPA: hypothetical protein VGQ40_07930 [Chthoniobacterales bacterium]|jgi:hypothetical protein|nr:hypothetical protein [Chthoniobacterales bacterium]